MSYQASTNPWDVANNPPEATQEYFGEASINAWFCMLVPGSGKQPYDERTLDPKTGEAPRRYTAIDVMVDPLSECGLQYDMKRTCLAEFGEWKETTWPSLKALGILNAQEIAGKFVRVEMVPTGRKYQGQNGEREATAIKFVTIYPDRASCLADWQASYGKNGHTAPAQTVTTTPAATAPTNGNGSNELETALKFAGVFVKQAVAQGKGDLDKTRGALSTMLANQAMIAKHFTVDSPEITELLLAEMSK
jgi:hypothetical protein